MPLPRLWTWLLLVLSTTVAVVLVDQFSTPRYAVAQDDSGLSEPVGPMLAHRRRGSNLKQTAWTFARQRMGANMPTGKGIPIAIVEGDSKKGYLPYIDPEKFPGKKVIPEADTDLPSAHASNVAKWAIGKDAPGLDVTDVYGWPTAEWIGSGYLNTGTLDPPKPDHPARVFNHSWISKDANAAPLVLRRVDYIVDQYDKIVVCGVNNGKGEVPALLSSAYNVISVGVPSGKSSNGLTTVEGEGRCKPELVAAGQATSNSTPVVTGTVAGMLELADSMVAEAPQGRNKDAARSETIKACLLAGCRRDRKWQTINQEPLDRTFGAGILDIDRTFLIHESGHYPADAKTVISQRYGWSFEQIAPGQMRHYRFIVRTKQGEGGFALVWNRRVLGGQAKLRNNQTGEERLIWNSAHYTPNIDLKLVRQVDEKTTEQVALSSSKVDNVELIHLRPLQPGAYTLSVKRHPDKTGMSWDYALAWRIEAHTDPADAPQEQAQNNKPHKPEPNSKQGEFEVADPVPGFSW